MECAEGLCIGLCLGTTDPLSLKDTFWRGEGRGLSVPNHKSQIASDLKSRSPNRKNFSQIAVSSGLNRTFKSRDL